MTLNKNEESIIQNGKQKFYRFPPKENYMNSHIKDGITIGSLYRLRNQNSNMLLLCYSILLLFTELSSIGYKKEKNMRLLNSMPNRMKEDKDKIFWRTLKSIHTIINKNYDANKLAEKQL